LSRVVLDASAGVDYLLATARADDVLAAFGDAERLDVPELFGVEVCAATRRQVLRGRMTPARAQRMLGDLHQLLASVWPHDGALLARGFELRENIGTYDAVYVALAEALGARLVTSDAPLAAAARLHTGLDVVDASVPSKA